MAGDSQEPAGNDPSPDNEPTLKEVAERQERTESKLDTLIDTVKGLGGGHKAAEETAAPADSGITLDSIKQAVRDVGAEQAQADADAAHAADHDKLRQPKEPEHAPRESMPTWKQKLQKAAFGIDI
jgi:hypothetical protein